ncbi:MAG: DUF3187 family protein [Woeseia sp.]
MQCRSWRAPLVASVCVAFCPGAHGAALPDHDLSPLIATLGLPRADEGANLLPAAGWRFSTSIATASHSSQQSAGNESLSIDGETTRVGMRFDYGISERLQLGVELPWLWNESGGLDSFIETWHDWFGLPNGFRDLVANNQLDFSYRDNGVERLAYQQNRNGLGDVRLLAAWQLQRDAQRTTALRASLQLPTGASSKLTGSGATALSVGIAGEHDNLFDSPRWSGFYRASLVLRDKQDRLPDRARRSIAVLAGGVSARASTWLELTLQGTLRTAAYDSDLRLLGETALQLNVGGTLTLSDTLQLAVAVGEDVRVNTAPDVTLALSLRYTPAER